MLKRTNCIKCNSRVFLNEKLCREHYDEMYDNKRFCKVKETAFRDVIIIYMLSSFSIDVKWNRQLEGTNIKPDIHFFLLDTLIIVEIDEYQHKHGGYNEKDEERNQKITDVYERTYIVRINPDSYKGGKEIWSKKTVVHKPGEIRHDVDMNMEEFDKRVEVVKSTLNNIVKSIFYDYNRPIQSSYFAKKEGFVEIQWLFFD